MLSKNNWKLIFYDKHIAILQIVKLSLFLSLLLLSKYKFGLYASFDGWEFVTGIWFLICLVTEWKQMFLLTLLYSIICGILYYWELAILYFIWYSVYIFIINILKKYLVNNVFYSSILGFVVGFTIFIFNFPINFIVYGANKNALIYSLSLIASALPINLIEGICTFLVIATLYPLFIKISIMKPWIADKKIYSYLISNKPLTIKKRFYFFNKKLRK